MPVSDDAMCRSPYVISRNGITTWMSAMKMIGPVQRRIPRSAPAFHASGTSTSAPSAIRAKTRKIGATSSLSATLMNR
jgi:hypothetical protein